MNLVDRMKIMASEKNTTLAAIGSELGYGKNTLRRWDDSIPACDRFFNVADYFEVDARYLFTGEIKNFDMPDKIKEHIKNYNNLTPEKQTLIDNMITALSADSEQVVPEEDEVIIQQLLPPQQKENKAMVLRMLDKQIADDIIKEVAEISDDAFEVIKQEFLDAK